MSDQKAKDQEEEEEKEDEDPLLPLPAKKHRCLPATGR